MSEQTNGSNAIALRDSRPAGLQRASQTKAVWAGAGSNLTPETARALAIVGQHYGLDPALGEVMILGNRVYVTMEGYTRIAESHPEYDGHNLRPLTEQERKEAMVDPLEHAWLCEVFRKDRRVPILGYGVASERTIQARPIQSFAREMAQKRAMHRALRAAFRASVPPVEIEVDGATGEIIDRETRPAPEATAVQPDWSRFWAKVNSWGLTRDQVHQLLGVESVKDWRGSLSEALDKLSLAVTRARDDERRRVEAEVDSEPFVEEPPVEYAVDPVEQQEILDEIAAGPPHPDLPHFAKRNDVLAWATRTYRLQPSSVLRLLGYSSWSDVNLTPDQIAAQLAAVAPPVEH